MNTDKISLTLALFVLLRTPNSELKTKN